MIQIAVHESFHCEGNREKHLIINCHFNEACGVFCIMSPCHVDDSVVKRKVIDLENKTNTLLLTHVG